MNSIIVKLAIALLLVSFAAASDEAGSLRGRQLAVDWDCVYDCEVAGYSTPTCKSYCRSVSSYG